MFAHLPRPFKPGTVIPSNRSSGEWHFTFRDANEETYHWRICDIATAPEAKARMRRFVEEENRRTT